MIVKLKQYKDVDGSHEEVRSRGYNPDLWLLRTEGGLYEWGCRRWALAVFASADEAAAALRSLTKEAAATAKGHGVKIFLVPPVPPTPEEVLFRGEISSAKDMGSK